MEYWILPWNLNADHKWSICPITAPHTSGFPVGLTREEIDAHIARMKTIFGSGYEVCRIDIQYRRGAPTFAQHMDASYGQDGQYVAIIWWQQEIVIKLFLAVGQCQPDGTRNCNLIIISPQKIPLFWRASIDWGDETTSTTPQNNDYIKIAPHTYDVSEPETHTFTIRVSIKAGWHTLTQESIVVNLDPCEPV